MNTRKFPRTMQEAFGPYTSFHIDEPVDKNDRIVIYSCAVAVMLLLATFFIWS